MKNEKLLAAVLAATMLSAPLTGCSNNRKSQEEIENENEIRRLLQQDSSLNIKIDDVRFNNVMVSWQKFYGNYYLCFETYQQNPTATYYHGEPNNDAFIVYQVDSKTYFNFLKDYGQKSYSNYRYKETSKDVELIKNITENFDPILSDYWRNVMYEVMNYGRGPTDNLYKIAQMLEEDSNVKIIPNEFGVNNFDRHGIDVSCEKNEDKYFVNFKILQDADKSEFVENLVDYIKISYEVDKTAYDYFKTVDLKDLANIDPVPFEVLTEQYDPINVEVFENTAEQEMSK